MKLSDKALRQIGRELLNRTDASQNQDDAETSPGKSVGPVSARRQRALWRTRSAAVLPFKKRLR